MANPPPATGARLMLVFTVTPALDPRMVEAAVRAGDVACVVLRTSAGEKLDAARLAEIAGAAQRHDAAVLLEGSEGLVASAGLDGVHVAAGPALDSALRLLKPAAIVGAAGLATRHEAMIAGESGADYVAFGALAPEPGEFFRVRDLVEWWAELFEVPCVGVASSLDEVTALAEAGADFIALSETLLASAGEAPKVVAAAQARLVSGDDAQ
ncbi:thiamine phosphate synthase [Xanthobacter aminoxidans]|uniref:thiamine phosphate synthase n=1 Tax=Xanthobacter aminoxidans TaxID=186280 RepID=UPI003727BF53